MIDLVKVLEGGEPLGVMESLILDLRDKRRGRPRYKNSVITPPPIRP